MVSPEKVPNEKVSCEFINIAIIRIVGLSTHQQERYGHMGEPKKFWQDIWIVTNVTKVGQE